MRPDEYLRHDALGLAALVHKGEVRAVELVEAAVALIEQVNGKVNAVVQKRYERARTVAEGPLPEGPFTGVPFLLKDLLVTEAGVPTSHGCRFFKDAVVDHDSELVVRQKRAGLVILGKTNASELGILPVTEPLLWGPARNPWALDRTCGGSSGGSAAAVAAGFVPMAHGSDGGGSIRIPASCCGLFGLKPSRGRVSPAPFVSGSLELSQSGPLSVSVRDAAAFLDVIAGYEPGDAHWAPPPARPFLDEVGADPGRLRIAFTVEPPIPRDVDDPG